MLRKLILIDLTQYNYKYLEVISIDKQNSFFKKNKNHAYE